MSDEKFQILSNMLKKKFKNKEVSISTGDEVIEKTTVKDFVDSGSVRMNLDLGGGYPRGRIIEIYGPEGSSKSTLALTAVRNEQALGNRCAYIDVERSLNKDYMVALGIDFNKLLLVQTDTAEEAWSAVEMIAQNGEISLIVVDSLAAMVPEAVREKGIEGDTMARLAAVNTKAITLVNPFIEKTGTTLILINQVRQGLDMFGPKETTPGGNIVKFFASQRLRVKRKSFEKDKDGIPNGQITQYQVIKNKVGPPGKEGEFKLIFGKGIDVASDLVDAAFSVGTVGLEAAGSWIKMDGKTICQGKENFTQMVAEDTELFDKIKLRLTKKEEVVVVSQ